MRFFVASCVTAALMLGGVVAGTAGAKTHHPAIPNLHTQTRGTLHRLSAAQRAELKKTIKWVNSFHPGKRIHKARAADIPDEYYIGYSDYTYDYVFGNGSDLYTEIDWYYDSDTGWYVGWMYSCTSGGGYCNYDYNYMLDDGYYFYGPYYGDGFYAYS